MNLPRFDPTQPAFVEDPYPVYAALRAADPVHWEGAPVNTWVLTRHADVAAALRDARLIKHGSENLLYGLAASVQAEVAPLAATLDHQLDVQNPPAHTRLRNLLHQAFTPHVVEALRPRIQALADTLLDAVVARGQTDLIADLAQPLPALVIMAMLGIPPDARGQIQQWSDVYAVLKGHGAHGDDPAGAARQANVTMAAFSAYLREVIGDRRQHLGDDLLSAMIRAEEQGDALSDDELVANARLLLIAGSETTTNLLGNGTLALLEQPEALARLRAQPGLIETAVEELLRYDSSSQMVYRWAAEDLTIGDRTLAAGQMVTLVLGAANRDPAVFPDPDRLDLARQPNHHAAFGFGAHYCLGAPLVRLEAQVVFPTLLRRLPDLRLGDTPPVRQPNPTLRGLHALPLRFTPSN